MYIQLEDEVKDLVVGLIYDEGQLIFEINGCVGYANLSAMEGALVLRCLQRLAEEMIQSLPEDVVDFWAEVHRDEAYHERMEIYTSMGFEETQPGYVWATVEDVLDSIQN